MKLLLTSAGITNKSIAKALFELVGKKPEDTFISFIPTAANFEKADKGWLIEDLWNLKNLKLKGIDIVDISALPQEIWLPRLETADVLFFSGGNTPHLMFWIEKSGLAKLLPELLKTRVWAGISAGSIVTNPTLALSNKDKRIYYEQSTGYKSEKGLGLVDFYCRPHLNAPHFPHVNEAYLREIKKDIPFTLYGLDDQSALKVTDGEVEVVTEGQYLKL